jgi:hypothetical protein
MIHSVGQWMHEYVLFIPVLEKNDYSMFFSIFSQKLSMFCYCFTPLQFYLVIFLQNFACISMICSAILPLDFSVCFLPSAFEIQLADRFKIQILLQNSNLTSIVFLHGAEWVRLESFNYLLPRYKTSKQNKRGRERES